MAVLVGADAYEFSWRYQLPALVILPAAGALGVAALGVRARRARAVPVPLTPAGTPEAEQASAA